MPEFRTKHRVGHSADNMFRLVADVARYPEFVPLCTSLAVISRAPSNEGEVLIANMGIGHKALKEQFTTKVVLNETANKIVVSYIDGPFRHLENQWCFTPLEASGSEVDFYICYEFRSALMGLALGPLFDGAFRRFTEAFEDRANEIYGKPVTATSKISSA